MIHDLFFKIVVIDLFFLLFFVELFILIKYFVPIFELIIFDFINSTNIHIILEQRMFIDLTPLYSSSRIILQTLTDKVIA